MIEIINDVVIFLKDYTFYIALILVILGSYIFYNKYNKIEEELKKKSKDEKFFISINQLTGSMVIIITLLIVNICLKGKNDSNDILNMMTSIVSSLITGLITLFVLLKTFENSRDSQNLMIKKNEELQTRLINLEEGYRLIDKRTMFSVNRIVDDYLLNEYKKDLYPGKIIIYDEINKLMFNKGTHKAYKHLLDNQYDFILINNIGKNPMYNVRINIKNVRYYNKINNEEYIEDLNCTVEFIDAQESLVLQLFKINENMNVFYVQTIGDILVHYSTDIYGLGERIITEIKGLGEVKTVKKVISIERVTEDGGYEFITENNKALTINFRQY